VTPIRYASSDVVVQCEWVLVVVVVDAAVNADQCSSCHVCDVLMCYCVIVVGFLHNVIVAGTGEHCEVDRCDEGHSGSACRC